MMICGKCDSAKSPEEFYVSNRSRCKECVKAAVRANRKRRAQYYRKYDRMRFQTDPKIRARHKRYQASEAGKQSMLKSRRKWMERHPERRAAHITLGNAVRDGKINKPDRCEACGDRHKRIHGHHEDYRKPLDVTWLCPPCHRLIHHPENAGI